jgi:hypothetical protein
VIQMPSARCSCWLRLTTRYRRAFCTVSEAHVHSIDSWELQIVSETSLVHRTAFAGMSLFHEGYTWSGMERTSHTAKAQKTT